MSSLPSHTERFEHYFRICESLRRFLAAHPHEPAAWIAVPTVAGAVSPAHAQDLHAQAPLSEAHLQRLLDRPERFTLGARKQEYRMVDRCISGSMGPNERRALDAVFDHLGWQESPTAAPAPASSRRARKLRRKAQALAEGLVDQMREEEVELPLPSSRVYARFLKAADSVATLEAVVASSGPLVAAVPSMHSLVARALVWVARQAAVPSVYVPHAPSIGLLELEELPVDYAALRGRMEVERFAEHGVDPGRLEVAGNPTVDEARLAELDLGRPPVLALSPFSEDMLVPLVDLVRSVLDDAVVAPHPRMDRDSVASLCPAGWEIWGGRTYDLLKSGPPMLIQCSSGVALESLHLGIPTIQLAFPGAVAYPFLREPQVPHASSPAELRAAIDEARAAAASPARREELLEWARAWSHPSGAEAAARVATLLESAAGAAPPGPIWDHWSAV